MQTGQIEDVSDTAFMVATWRAIETRRADALFRDPLAAKLAGSHGGEIVRSRRQWSILGQWLVAIRTRIIDAFIENAIADGAGTILNLGAGLDTRPYRMDLPEHIRWIEVDYPKVIELKERTLSSEKPRCHLERIKLDLTDIPARKRMLAEIAANSGKTLALTEGVIPYLRVEDVASLADDLRGHAAFQYWIVDYSSPEARALRRRAGRKIQMQNAPFLFEPADYFGFFSEHGWRAEDIRYVPEEAHKLKRPVPLPFLWRWRVRLMSLIAGRRSRRALQKSTAYVLLRPS
jgi:methyltransferase (TIGR00027 family)